MSRSRFLLIGCFLLMGCALPMHAATRTCTYNFQSGTGNSFLHFCVSVNGNISVITTPDGDAQLASAGEGYGVCATTSPTRYEDYGTSDTGNWHAPILLSKTTSSVKIARTTSDGHWTLTQTISRNTKAESITVVMALSNNQPISDGAFLVRFADPDPEGQTDVFYSSSINGVFATEDVLRTDDLTAFLPGLQLQNVGTPQFAFWQAYVQTGHTGPNACAFSANAIVPPISQHANSIEFVYVDNVPAGGTKTATVTYRGF